MSVTSSALYRSSSVWSLHCQRCPVLLPTSPAIDGDTLEIHGTRIRLYGIDALESGQACMNGEYVYRCGQEAALALSDRISGETIICQTKGAPDHYGRVVAVCQTYFSMADLANWMVDRGWALVYRSIATIQTIARALQS